jgi:hypothetical protein
LIEWANSTFHGTAS